MPRDSQGNYTLPPAYNPVIPGTLIESAWANTTMSDVAEALTNSLPRDGSAPMTGQLTLSPAAPTNPRHATSKQYVDNFVAFSTGLPIGAVISLAGATPPAGFILCNGQAVSRTTYSVLFGAIGTTYGSGDGSTTFNVPDARDYFIRGRGVGRALGSLQSSAFGAHIHPISDLGHTHIATQLSHAHSLTTGAHTHGITDPGHTHGILIGGGSANPNIFPGNQNNSIVAGTYTSQSNVTGVSVQSASALTGTTDSQTPAITVQTATTGVSVGSTGDTETRPQNIAFDYYIKALEDSVGPVAILNITSADPNLIDIDFTIPTAPQLVPKANIAFGMVKLDAAAKVPLAQMPFTATSLLGYFDASSGQNPSQAFPLLTFVNGNQYIVSVTGVIPVRDPVTGVESPHSVGVGSFLTFIKGSPTLPDGWYTTPAPSTLPASSVSFVPGSGISASNVQDAIVEVKAESGDMFKADNLAGLANNATARTNIGAAASGNNTDIDALLDLTGNVEFTGTSNRIKGDFSNGTVMNRVAFQTSVVDGPTSVGALPNGTNLTASFTAYGAADPTNASFARMAVTSGTDVRFTAGANGTGTLLNMAFSVGGSVRYQYGVAGEFGIGGANYGTAGQVLRSAGPGAPPTWGTAAGGGATGPNGQQIFVENERVLSSNYTLGETGMTAATISIASPAVITQTNTFAAGQEVFFKTTGALPTGLSVNTTYYISATGLTGTTYQVSATRGGASINTSGTQSGTHTAGKAKSAETTGPLVIATGAVLTVPTGQRCVVL